MDIGSRLHDARRTRGLTLRDIASTTKISMAALVAMESNDFGRLPGGVFRKAYVRAFAAEVGLNGEELAAEYEAAFESTPSGPGQLLHLSAAQRVGVVIAGVLLAGLLVMECARLLADV